MLCKEIVPNSPHTRTKFEVCTFSGSKVMGSCVKIHTHGNTEGKLREIGQGIFCLFQPKEHDQ